MFDYFTISATFRLYFLNMIYYTTILNYNATISEVNFRQQISGKYFCRQFFVKRKIPKIVVFKKSHYFQKILTWTKFRSITRDTIHYI